MIERGEAYGYICTGMEEEEVVVVFCCLHLLRRIGGSARRMRSSDAGLPSYLAS